MGAVDYIAASVGRGLAGYLPVLQHDRRSAVHLSDGLQVS